MGALIDTGHVVAGRYRLISALGNGGMGTVWLAEDELLHRRVAVKEVSPPADMTAHEREMLRERTLREARTAARLNHPNVVAIYDVVEDDGRPWIVMELVPSRSLRDVVQENGPLTAQQAAAAGLQVLAALNAAHALGIMHRDVKPGNVLIDATGRAVLADFGIARTQDSSTLTTSGMIVGSPSYIAPERARGERGGPESDLWSLGATLYALVEGRPAYDRAGPLPTLVAVVNEDPDPPSRAGPLWPVIRGLLDHVPSRRLGPAEAERMLRQVAGTGTVHVSDTLAEFPPPAVPGAGADPTRPGSSLESAEHTQTLRPWDADPPAEPDPVPLPREPDSGPLPAEPDPEPLPVEPDPEPLPTEPDPGVLPEEPDPGPLPEEPDPAALPEEPDPAALVPEARHEAAPAPVTIEDWSPEAQAPGGSPHRKQLTWVLAAAAALALVAGAVVAMIATTHHPALATGNRGHPTTRPASSHSPASKPSATSGSSTSPPAASPVPASPTPAQGTPGPAAIPAGYHGFRNSTGFSIAVPDGWRVSHQGHYVYLLPPSGGDFLLIDQSDHPQPNPLADWRQQEANRESTYPGYHRIRLESVRYAPAEKAADWEFTYYHQGVLTHVLNRNVLANAHHAYALYWSTPESQWGQSWHIFKVLAATFRPAAP
ncbi:MAG TPA: protein kinase [Streptosporangiaceae bacterium]|nr:protein kinase [Streptosporangiaceae bacterium]